MLKSVADVNVSRRRQLQQQLDILYLSSLNSTRVAHFLAPPWLALKRKKTL